MSLELEPMNEIKYLLLYPFLRFLVKKGEYGKLCRWRLRTVHAVDVVVGGLDGSRGTVLTLGPQVAHGLKIRLLALQRHPQPRVSEDYFTAGAFCLGGVFFMRLRVCVCAVSVDPIVRNEACPNPNRREGTPSMEKTQKAFSDKTTKHPRDAHLHWHQHHPSAGLEKANEGPGMGENK